MSKILKKPTDFKQYDSRWKYVDYNSTIGNGGGSTIGNSGCGPTSASDIANKFVSSAITPKVVAKWMQAKGYKCSSGGTYSSAFAAYFDTLGIDCDRITGTSQIWNKPNSPYIKEALNALEDGDYVIALMGKGTWTKGGHFICVYGYKDNTVYVCDPASTREARLHGNLTTWKKEIKELFVVHIAEYLNKDKKQAVKELTKEQKFIKGLQKSLNADYNCHLKVDYLFGPKTSEALAEHNIKKGSEDATVCHLQYWLNDRGFRDKDGKKLDVDGDFGAKTEYVLKKAQEKLGVKQDGEFGANTCKKFLELF